MGNRKRDIPRSLAELCELCPETCRGAEECPVLDRRHDAFYALAPDPELAARRKGCLEALAAAVLRRALAPLGFRSAPAWRHRAWEPAQLHLETREVSGDCRLYLERVLAGRDPLEITAGVIVTAVRGPRDHRLALDVCEVPWDERVVEYVEGRFAVLRRVRGGLGLKITGVDLRSLRTGGQRTGPEGLIVGYSPTIPATVVREIQVLRRCRLSARVQPERLTLGGRWAQRNAAAATRAASFLTVAVSRSSIKTPSERWVDKAGLDLTYVAELRSRPTVTARVDSVWPSEYGKRRYPGKLMSVVIRGVPRRLFALAERRGWLVRADGGRWPALDCVDGEVFFLRQGGQGHGRGLAALWVDHAPEAELTFIKES